MLGLAGKTLPALDEDRVGSGQGFRVSQAGAGRRHRRAAAVKRVSATAGASAASAISPSARPTRSAARCPHSASRRIARRCSESSPTSPSRPRSGAARPAMIACSRAIARAVRAASAGVVLGPSADHRQPLSEPSAGRPLGLEQGPQGQQVVGQRLERRQPLTAHLKARQRPGELAGAGQAPRDQVIERPQLILARRRARGSAVAGGRWRRSPPGAMRRRRSAPSPSARSRSHRARTGAAP